MAGFACPFTCAQKLVLPLVSLNFLFWVISLGGLGSLQYLCTEPFSNTGYLSGVRGLSPVHLTCSRVYSYYWWIVALEFIVLCGLALTIAGGHLSAMRLAWTGLLAVATALCTQAADTFLTINSVQHYQSGLELHTSRGAAAGFIMTATINMLLLLVVGAESKESANCPYNKREQAEGEERA